MKKKIGVVIALLFVGAISGAAQDCLLDHASVYDPERTAELAKYLQRDTVNKGIVKQLIESKADPEMMSPRGTLLVRALEGPSAGGHYCNDFVRYLLEHKANPNRIHEYPGR